MLTLFEDFYPVFLQRSTPLLLKIWSSYPHITRVIHSFRGVIHSFGEKLAWFFKNMEADGK